MSWARRLKRVFGVEIECCALRWPAEDHRQHRGAAAHCEDTVAPGACCAGAVSERAGRGPLVLSSSEGRRGRHAGGEARWLGGPATAKGSAPAARGFSGDSPPADFLKHEENEARHLI
jgi:hypothetical protein